MSLYHHIGSKDELVDALVDWVFLLIELPDPEQPWRTAMARRASSARTVLAAHPWALGILESRTHPGPALLRHHDAVLGSLRRGGFSIDLAAHAFSTIDAYVYGFVLTELHLPFTPGEGAEELVEQLALPVAEYPHLAELIATTVAGQDYAYADEFTDGLEMILDALAARHAAAGSAQ